MKFRIASKSLNNKPNRRRLLQALGFACLSAAALSTARAQTAYTWDGGTGNWSNNSMWNVMMSPNDPSADVYVDGGKTGVNSVVNVDGGYTVGRLTVDAGDTVNINDNQTLTVQTGSFTGSGSVIDNGTINVASGGNDGTALHFTNGAASLSGTGTLNMFNNAFVYADSGNLLTIGAGFTVAGQGQLGNGSTAFANSGTVNANINGGTLDLRPGGGTNTFTNAVTGAAKAGANTVAVNHGLVEASNGGTLNVDGNNGGVFSNGTFQALTGSTVNIINGATISNATLTTAGTGVINFFNGTLSNVTSTGVINVPDNNTGTLAGTFTNSSTLTINSGGNNGTGLALIGSVTLAGTGTINMVNNAFLYSNNSGGNVLTVGPGVTIEGQGQLGNGSTAFVNSGLINANISGGTLDLRPGGAQTTFTNQGAGLAEASAGGTLNIDGYNGGVFNGGTFRALANSTVNIFDGTTVSNATLTTAGTGVINLSGGSTLSNVTSTGIINVPDNNTGMLSGTFTNSSTLTVASAGNNGTILGLSGPVVLAGTGTITMTNNAQVYGSGGSLLTIGAGVTIQGQGTLGAGATTFANNGLINANVSGQVLELRPGGGTATFTNSATGLAEASNGGVLNLRGYNGGIFNNGNFAAQAGSTVNIFDSATVNTATLATAGTGTFNLYGSSILNNVTSVATINIPDNNLGELGGVFTNNGTLNVASGGNNGTTLYLPGNVTLAGTGTINLLNNAFLYGNGTQLTIGAGQLIQGQGTLGDGLTSFVNNGTINANVSGQVLEVRPDGNNGAPTFTNQGAGVAEASNGGVLNLRGYNGGVFTGGSFQALANSTVNIFDGAVLTTTTLSGTGTFNLYGNSVLSNVTSTGTINVPDNSTGYLANTFTNNGTLNVASGGNNGTTLFLSNNVTLAGTGVINLLNNAFLYGSGGTSLTVGANVTIQGQGTLGNGGTTFLNNGLVNANVSGGTLDVRPGGGTGTFVNQGAGRAVASNGGTLDLDGYTGGTFSGGTFSALAGSTLNIFNGTTVSGATIATTGTGFAQLYGNATLSNVTSTGTINVPDNSTGYLANTFTNNGTLNVASDGNNGTTLYLPGNVTLAGTGVINLLNNAFLYGNGTQLTIGANATVAGTGQLGYGTTTFVNNGTVNGNISGGNLDVRPSNGGGVADFTNTATGLVEATGGGTVHLDGYNGGLFTNNGTFAVVSGSTGGSSNLNVDAGTLTNYTGTTLTGGTYKVLATDASAISTLSVGGGAITANAASVVLSGANSVFNEINSVATNTGSFAVANGRNFTTAGALANSGTLVAAGGSVLTIPGGLTETSTSTLTGAGTFSSPVKFMLSGNINPGGTINPATGAFADAAGTTNLNGDVAFDVNTKFHFELGAMTGTNDHLNITGGLNLNGTLNVTALAGFGAGTYDLIDHGTLPLVTSGLTLGTLPAGYTYVLLYLPTQVDLVVAPLAVPEPETWAFVLGGGALLLGVQRARRSARRGV